MLCGVLCRRQGSVAKKMTPLCSCFGVFVICLSVCLLGFRGRHSRLSRYGDDTSRIPMHPSPLLERRSLGPPELPRMRPCCPPTRRTINNRVLVEGQVLCKTRCYLANAASAKKQNIPGRSLSLSLPRTFFHNFHLIWHSKNNLFTR